MLEYWKCGNRNSDAKVLFVNYVVPGRKIGFFVKIKEDENFNRRNTGSISRIKI
jgi:hypothetical protein